ncbi:MAG TPA: hypothetical protein VKJ45_13100, partial [Blastocatellia bacterium]|nr:hypothetical protein [Blastocatellia bacterium]
TQAAIPETAATFPKTSLDFGLLVRRSERSYMLAKEQCNRPARYPTDPGWSSFAREHPIP